ncbi:MAG: GspE/PulE family protein, partial [Gemmataceae bacterium]
MAKNRGDFTDILIRDGFLSADQLEEARSMQAQTGAKLHDMVVKLGYCSTEQAMKAVAEHSNFEFIDLSDKTIPPSIVELVPESVARENLVFPLSLEGNTLKISMSDPTDFDTLAKLQFILNKDVQPTLASKEQIIEAINRHYGQTETESVDSMLAEFTDTAIDFTETEALGSSAGQEENSDSPIIKLVNLIISEAIGLRASDIHIEPFADRIRIRYRIDGVLIERDNPPRRMLAPILSRLKIMGNIDIAEKRRCQDGRIKTIVNGKPYDMRVSVLPTVQGQSIVMRILDRGNISVNIRDLGFAEEDYQRFQAIIKRPNGIFLVTGPTGSGKTTTLYAALNEQNRPDKKIITAEDPVEYYLPGINQCEVKHKIGLDFARIIRSML